MIAITKKIVLLVLGWLFVLTGIAGLFLPILQGVLFIFIGLVILSKESKKARELLFYLKEKYPGPFQAAMNLHQRFIAKVRGWVRKL